MKTLLTSALWLFTLSLTAHSANSIDGKWQAQFPAPSAEPVFVVIDMKATGNTVAGIISNRSGSEQLHKLPIEDGILRGDTVTFKTFHPVPFLFGKMLMEWERIVWNWGAALNTISGTVHNDTIIFTQRDWKGDTLQFQAIRVK